MENGRDFGRHMALLGAGRIRLEGVDSLLGQSEAGTDKENGKAEDMRPVVEGRDSLLGRTGRGRHREAASGELDSRRVAGYTGPAVGMRHGHAEEAVGYSQHRSTRFRTY